MLYFRPTNLYEYFNNVLNNETIYIVKLNIKDTVKYNVIRSSQLYELMQLRVFC